MPGDLIDTEFGLALSGGGVGQTPKALCHPQREMSADGLCAPCLAMRTKIDVVTQALTKSPDEAGITAPTPEVLATRAAIVDLYRYAEYAEGIAEYARAILVHSLPRHAELLLKAAEVAATNGDSKPMQFALQYAKMTGGKTAVDAPEKTPVEKAGKNVGVKVMIGVAMGAMPAANVLSAEVVPAED